MQEIDWKYVEGGDRRRRQTRVRSTKTTKSKSPFPSAGIASGQQTILQLIEHLEPFLVDPVPATRVHGLAILTHVLQHLPIDHLDGAQLKVICTFYANKLNDHHQVN